MLRFERLGYYALLLWSGVAGMIVGLFCAWIASHGNGIPMEWPQ